MRRKNPAAKAVRSPDYKPKVINGNVPDGPPGCHICGDASAPNIPHVDYVHGHIQCGWCGLNVGACCEGEVGNG